MKPLIDGDILRYEIGFAAEYGWQSDNPEEIPPWNYVSDLLDAKIKHICDSVEATEKPTIYLTGEGNFRDDVATVKVYKGNRLNSKKPWHFKNLTAYILCEYDCIVTEGIEADDQMAIDQTEKTIICSRDKDLRQVPGWHFGWECGKQGQFGPHEYDLIGEIDLSERRDKIIGGGLKFFYSQVLTGDVVDNVPGLPKCGAVKAFKLLSGIDTAEGLLKVVSDAYKDYYGDSWEEALLEQAKLLWMVRELDEKGEPVMWEFNNELETNVS